LNLDPGISNNDATAQEQLRFRQKCVILMDRYHYMLKWSNFLSNVVIVGICGPFAEIENLKRAFKRAHSDAHLLLIILEYVRKKGA